MIKRKKSFRLEKKAKAKADDLELIKHLRKSTLVGADDAAEELQQYLDGYDVEPSFSRLHARSVRKNLVRECIGVLPAYSYLHTVSAIAMLPLIPRGQLAESLNLGKFVYKEATAIRRALPTGVLFIGGVDFSLNSFDNGEPHWQPHIYGILGDNLNGVTHATRRGWLVPRYAKSTARPLQVKQLKSLSHLERVASYMLKSQFYHRSSYEYERQKTGKPSQNTAHQNLAAKDAIELALFLRQYRVTDRLIQVGVKRYKTLEGFVFRPS